MADWDRVPTTDEWVESVEGLPILGDLVLAADAGFEHFCATHPYPWLMFGGERNDLRRPGDPGSADSCPAAGPATQNPGRSYLAFAVQPRAARAELGVSVGSSPSCDVVVPDEMVADLHAYIREDKGEFFLAPGPEVRIAPLKLNHAPVSPADPMGVPLRSGDIVILHDLELAFLNPKDMFELVQQLS